MHGVADSIWKKVLSSNYLEEGDILACQSDIGCVEALAEKWRYAANAEKLEALPYLAEVGGQHQPAEGEAPGRFGPFLVEDRLVAVMTEALASPSSEIRDAAGKILALDTPDTLVRNHAAPLEKALAAFPGISHRELLLGKLGSRRALEMLRASHSAANSDSLDLRAALGRLRDHARENSLILAYGKEIEPSEKRQYAWYLGYMAQPASVLALARDLRTPFAYEWNQTAKRSFRIHVIAALSLAYPREPVLWPPVFRPEGDEYYARIEAWAEKVLGVEWTRPRPPFLYEQEVPMPMPGAPR